MSGPQARVVVIGADPRIPDGITAALRRLGIPDPAVEALASIDGLRASIARDGAPSFAIVVAGDSPDADLLDSVTATRDQAPRAEILVLLDAERRSPRPRDLHAAGANDLLVPMPGSEGRALADDPTVRRTLGEAIETFRLRAELERSATLLEEARGETARHDAILRELYDRLSGGLCSPVAAIATHLGELREGAHGTIGREASDYLRIAIDGCSQLGKLGRDLMLIRRLDEDDVALRLQTVGLDEIFSQVIAIHEGRAASAAVSIVALRTGLVAHTDSIRLTQVLSHLVDNALRSSPEDGTIIVAARREGPDRILCTVTDDGPGICETEHERAFERLQKCGLDDPALVPGAGLGLAICQGLIHALGGTIELSSAPDEGTRVRFTIPAAPAETLPAVEAPNAV